MDIWHGCNTSEAGYLSWVPEEYWKLWSETDRQWAATLWQSIEFRDVAEPLRRTGRALKSLSPGVERNRVVTEMRRLRDDDA